MRSLPRMLPRAVLTGSLGIQQREVRDRAIRQAPEVLREGCTKDRNVTSLPQLRTEHHILLCTHGHDVPRGPRRDEGYMHFLLVLANLLTTELQER